MRSGYLWNNKKFHNDFINAKDSLNNEGLNLSLNYIRQGSFSPEFAKM